MRLRLPLASFVVLGMLALFPHTSDAQPCQTLSLPELNTIEGTISNADCVMTPFRNARGEFWNVFLNAGETVIITMNRVSMQDPYLYLLNPSATVVASNDDAVPPNRNARIQYVAAATGMHRVIATTFALQPTADNGTFEIRAEIAGHPACQLRNLPSATTMNATLDATDCIVQPYRGARGELWTLTATAGNPIVVDMNRFTLTDPYLFLLDANSQPLASNDDFVPPNRDARISIASAPYTGTYYVVATTFAASDPGAYSIRATTAPLTVQPPTNLYVSALSGNTVTFRFTAPTVGPAATGFLLEGGVNPGEVLASVLTGSDAPIFTVVAPSGSFYVRARAISGSQISDTSNEIRIHVNVPVAPSAPDLFSSVVNGNAIVLGWRNTFAGGVPTQIVLDITGSATNQIQLGVLEGVAVNNLPPGTYTMSLRALNSGGSSPPSAPVTVTIPGPCSGPPAAPSNFLAYVVGTTVYVVWDPPLTGPAAATYLLSVTGSFVGSFPSLARSLSGTAGPGSYTLTVTALNACGASAPTPAQTVQVP